MTLLPSGITLSATTPSLEYAGFALGALAALARFSVAGALDALAAVAWLSVAGALELALELPGISVVGALELALEAPALAEDGPVAVVPIFPTIGGSAAGR